MNSNLFKLFFNNQIILNLQKLNEVSIFFLFLFLIILCVYCIKNKVRFSIFVIVPIILLCIISFLISGGLNEFFANTTIKIDEKSDLLSFSKVFYLLNFILYEFSFLFFSVILVLKLINKKLSYKKFTFFIFGFLFFFSFFSDVLMFILSNYYKTNFFRGNLYIFLIVLFLIISIVFDFYIDLKKLWKTQVLLLALIIIAVAVIPNVYYGNHDPLFLLLLFFYETYFREYTIIIYLTLILTTTPFFLLLRTNILVNSDILNKKVFFPYLNGKIIFLILALSLNFLEYVFNCIFLLTSNINGQLILFFRILPPLLVVFYLIENLFLLFQSKLKYKKIMFSFLIIVFVLSIILITDSTVFNAFSPHLIIRIDSVGFFIMLLIEIFLIEDIDFLFYENILFEKDEENKILFEFH